MSQPRCKNHVPANGYIKPQIVTNEKITMPACEVIGKAEHLGQKFESCRLCFPERSQA